MFRSSIASVISLFLGPTAGTLYAAECTGAGYNFTQMSETVELGEGHSVIVWKGHAILVDDDPNGIYHMSSGPCIAVFSVLPDGGFKAAGNCSYTDGDGDFHSDRWWQEPGANRGRWETIHGSGKFAATVGDSGWYETVMENGLASVGRWGGECSE